MVTVECPRCNKTRELKAIETRSSGLCRSCSSTVSVRQKKDFVRVCEVCGDEKKVRSEYAAKPKRCVPCASRETALKQVRTKRVRHFRICPECPEDDNTKQVVNKSSAGVKLCAFHTNVKKRGDNYERNLKKRKAKAGIVEPEKKKRGKYKKSGKPVKTNVDYIPQEAIDKAREMNRLHREANKERKKAKTNIMSEEDMQKHIKAYYESNEVIHVDCHESYGESTLQRLTNG